VLSKYGHIESIPEQVSTWGIKGMAPGRAASLGVSLRDHREQALLFRQLATLRTDVPLAETLDDLEWKGARPQLKELCAELNDTSIAERVSRWR
jgi:5'-3' exonuclease